MAGGRDCSACEEWAQRELESGGRKQEDEAYLFSFASIKIFELQMKYRSSYDHFTLRKVLAVVVVVELLLLIG